MTFLPRMNGFIGLGGLGAGGHGAGAPPGYSYLYDGEEQIFDGDEPILESVGSDNGE